MVSSQEIQQLAKAAYCFIHRQVLAEMGWVEFETMFAEYSYRRGQPPLIYIDILPLLVYQSVGRSPEDALPLAAAWIQFLLSGRVLDDVLDDEGLEKPWRQQGIKTGLATGLFAIGGANVALAQLADREAAVDIAAAFNRTLALAAQAEAQSMSKMEVTVEAYFRAVIAKTGMVFATGVWAAARLAIGDKADPRLQAFYDFGLNMGLLVQIIDDCSDLAIDVTKGYWSLPVLQSLGQKQHPLYENLVTLLTQETIDEHSANRIVAIVEEMGALAWSLKIAAVYQERAISAISGIAGIDSTELVNYVAKELA